METPPHARMRRAGDEGDNLVAREHERREFKTLPQNIADTSFAIDGNAGRLQIGNVAIDGALQETSRRSASCRAVTSRPPRKC